MIVLHCGVPVSHFNVVAKIIICVWCLWHEIKVHTPKALWPKWKIEALTFRQSGCKFWLKIFFHTVQILNLFAETMPLRRHYCIKMILAHYHPLSIAIIICKRVIPVPKPVTFFFGYIFRYNVPSFLVFRHRDHQFSVAAFFLACGSQITIGICLSFE